MRREIIQKIEIPEGIEVSVEGSEVTVKGPQGELKRDFPIRNVEVKKEGNAITIGCAKATKKEKKEINTARAHLRNMIAGAKEKFEYKMKICYSHFPITAEVHGEKMIIKNFLGERANRETNLPKGAEVKVDRDFITITSANKEIAGQAAANIERATKVSKRDRRVFQDGIFMISKAGKEI